MSLTDLSSAEIVGLTLIGEGRGEPIESQVAIGSVIRNRVNLWKNTYYDTCLKPEQFSCWNKNDPNYPILIELSNKLLQGRMIDDIYLLECLYIGAGIVLNQIRDNTNYSLYYLTTKLFNSSNKPEWAKTAKNIRAIGNQIYFNLG